MKKTIALTLALTMILALFTGCSSNQQPADGTASATSTTVTSATSTVTADTGSSVDLSNEYLVFATDQVGTSSYNIAVEMSKYFEAAGIGTVDVQPISPGGMGSPYLFSAGTCDIAFVNGAPAKWARETGTLGKEPTSGYEAVAGGLTAVTCVNLFTNAFIEKYGVTTIEEALRQKLPVRIGCSNPGSMDNQCVQLFLDYMGVTKEDLESWGGSWVTGGGSDMSAMISDGQLDYYLDQTSANSSTMTEIAMTTDVTFLQWEDATIDHFVNDLGFQRVALPANSFKNQDKEIVMPGSPDCLFVSENLSEDVVYVLTKTICENRDALVATYASLAPFDPETCWESEKIGGNPLHPGAEKYYKEMGYIK
ncbi:MAG: TAXI family TRAP transporter solute-binding subunit [Oscillospiraceae bacterium]